MTLANKVAIVTGGARGLGRAYARHLTQLGARVFAFDLDPGQAAAFDEGAPDAVDASIVPVWADLTDRAQVDAAVCRVIGEAGGVDILVNNAGGAFAPIERSTASVMPDEDIDRILNINLKSTIYCCQAVIPTMKAREGGAIVNTASVAGRIVAPGGRLAHYSVAKAAVAHFTRNLAAEVGPDGIRVNCIAPGTIMTGRIKALSKERGIGTNDQLKDIPLRRFGTPEECANVVAFLVSDMSAYITGQCISVCGGVALSPS